MVNKPESLRWELQIESVSFCKVILREMDVDLSSPRMIAFNFFI